MRKMMHVITMTLLLWSVSAPHAQLLSGPKADAYPIIAQLYADPGRYVGHTVMVYGLVIAKQSPSSFMLQDVSQHPLKIVGNATAKAAVGDQLIVVGMFHASGDPYLAATSLIRAKVLAGGGCC